MEQAGGKIRGITLDVGGTLISPHPSVGHVYAEAARKLGMGDFSPELLTQQFMEGWREKGFFDYSLDHWRDLVKRSFAGLAPVTDKLFGEIYAAFGEASRWKVYKEVPAALQGLKERGIKLAAVSNWDQRLRPLLKDLGLSQHFEAVVVSVEVGAAKPDARIFEKAAEALSLPLDTLLHVGDSEREDFNGAQAAGMMALLLNREEVKVGGNASMITDLSAVLRILDKPV